MLGRGSGGFTRWGAGSRRSPRPLLPWPVSESHHYSTVPISPSDCTERGPQIYRSQLRFRDCFGSATLSGSGTKAAPPVIAQGAIGTSDERVQWPERAAAPPDDLVSCCAREMVAGAGFSPARARWMVRLSERASADEPSRLHPLRPPAARRGVPATSTTPLDAGPLKRSGLRNGCRTASSGGFRGRARVRFWHAVGREDPIGRLRCEFEVGLSLKNTRAAARTKTRAIRKKICPVVLSF